MIFTLNPAVAVNGTEDLYAIDGTITNNTTLTFNRTVTSATRITVKWYVVEFKNNVLTQKGRKTGITTTSNIVGADGFPRQCILTIP